MSSELICPVSSTERNPLHTGSAAETLLWHEIQYLNDDLADLDLGEVLKDRISDYTSLI